MRVITIRKVVTTLLVIVALMISGCVSTPSGTTGDGAAGDGVVNGVELLVSPVETPETLVYRGVTVSAPMGFRFESAYGAEGSSTVWDHPYGVLVRLRNDDATVRGSIEFVYLAEDYQPIEYLDEYREAYLEGASGTTVAFRGGDEPVFGMITSGGDNGGGASGTRNRLVALYPMTGRVSRDSAIVLDLSFPTEDEQSRREAISIANSIQVPGVRDDMRIHARRSEDSPRVSFVDRSGRWRWVTDVPGGFIVHATDGDGDAFLMVAHAETFSAARPGVVEESLDTLVDTGVSVAVDRGAWRWSVPMGAFPDDRCDRFLSIPPNPDTASGAIFIVASTPARVWRDGTTRVEPWSDQRIATAIGNFIDWRLQLE